MTLSLAMIVKDEQDGLVHCLLSVKGLVDEMVVIDTGSTDRTKSIAWKAGAQVHDFGWQGSFADARNVSMFHCKGDWILVLDGDESLNRADHEKIRALMSDDRYDMYEHVMRHYYLDGRAISLAEVPIRCGDDGYPPYRINDKSRRLFRNLPGFHWENRLHEKLFPAVPEERVGKSDFVVHHYGKTNKAKEGRKAALYLDIAKREWLDNKEDDRCLFNYMMQARAAKDWAAVAGVADICRTLKKKAPLSAAIMAGEAAHYLGRPNEALQYYRIALAAAPDNAYALNRAAITLSSLGRGDEARGLLVEAIKASPSFTSSHLILADLERERGNEAAALGVLRHGLKDNPGDARLMEELHGKRV